MVDWQEQNSGLYQALKLEKLVVELTTEGFDKEQVVGAAWLAGERG